MDMFLKKSDKLSVNPCLIIEGDIIARSTNILITAADVVSWAINAAANSSGAISYHLATALLELVMLSHKDFPLLLLSCKKKNYLVEFFRYLIRNDDTQISFTLFSFSFLLVI